MSVYPRADEAGLTEFEMDCRDWGFVFGVTYGIARGEEPYESDDSVCERAMMAAREAFARFSKADIFTADAFEKDRSIRPAPSTAQDEDGGERSARATGWTPRLEPGAWLKLVDRGCSIRGSSI